MRRVVRILVSQHSADPFRAALPMALLVALAATMAGCGQQGALYLPTEPAAARRAALPETLAPTAAAPRPTAPASQ